MTTVDFKDLVLDGSEHYAVQKAGRSKPVFEVVANSGADFAVRRTVGKSTRLLVMLVSQGQFYVKNERTDEVSDLDYKSLTSFLSGCSNIHIGCLWLDDFENKKENRALLIDIIRKPAFKETASSGLWQLDCHEETRHWGDRSERFEGCAEIALSNNALLKSVAKLCKQSDARKRSILKRSIGAFSIIETVFSLDEARVFAQRLADSDSNSPIGIDVIEDVLEIQKRREGIFINNRGLHFVGGSYGHHFGQVNQQAGSGEIVKFKFSSFVDYVFGQSVKEGFAAELNEWLVIWKDTLLMQIAIYGETIDKYPENLLSLHHILAARTNAMQKELEKGVWELAERRLSEFDWTQEDEDMVITHPKSPDDFFDEARAQSNCVASYYDAVINGRTFVLFGRRKDDLEKSYLTIEVSGDKPTLRQVKAKFNREASDEDMLFLDKWCEACKINRGRYEERMLALKD